MTREIMIVTGEASGDLHGANLLRAMRRSSPDLAFCGMGGSELASLGMEILYDAGKVAVVGVIEVFSHLGDIFRAQHILKTRMRERPPALLVIIDLPDFNLLLAKRAKTLGIPVFYYITPQVWAWRSGRVRTIGQRVDKVGVILPFEEAFFKDRGIVAEYVGHPLLDSVRVSRTVSQTCEKYRIDPGCRRIGILPGSRKKEISTLFPIFLEAAGLLQKQTAEPLVFLLPLAPTIEEEDLWPGGLHGRADDLDIRVIKTDRYEVMAACEAVIAASGTVTLELALLDVPMVVAYRFSPLTYQLGRMLVKLQHFSLVNLIAGEEVVPELLQDEVSPENIASQIMSFLYDQEKRAKICKGLQEVRKRLGGQGASERAAQLALQMLEG